MCASCYRIVGKIKQCHSVVFLVNFELSYSAFSVFCSYLWACVLVGKDLEPDFSSRCKKENFELAVKSVKKNYHGFWDPPLTYVTYDLLLICVTYDPPTRFRSMLQLCGNQSIDLEYKSMNWFLHNCNTGLKWVNLCNLWSSINLCIQFHWQLFITYSSFCFVNILLRKFDKQQKNAKKKYVNMK